MNGLKEVLLPTARVTLRDRAVFNDFFSKVEQPLADTTFTMRHIWGQPLKHTWTIINSNLCVFGFLKDRFVVWGPPVGGTRLAETINRCFSIVEKANSARGIDAKPMAVYIPEELKQTYEAVARETGGSLNYWTQDYIYLTKDLVELKGPEYDSQRHKVNFFMKNYDYSVEEFDWNVHADDCLHLIEIWRGCKSETLDGGWRYELESEANVAKRTVKFARRLGVRGVVLKVDNQIAGVSLGEPLTGDMCSNIIEKTNPMINGSAEFIFREFAKMWPSFKFLNAQDDFGVDYLKRVKLSYNPIMLLKSYCLEKK